MDEEILTTEDAQLEKIIANLEEINNTLDPQDGGDE